MQVSMPRAIPRSAEGGFTGNRLSPPLNSTTLSFAPGSSLMRLRTSTGMAIVNPRETVTVVMPTILACHALEVDTRFKP